ncbi:MAG: hypothetical protein JWO91_738 [Acidobacteriaceae bacterium]|nr:hypothetical protein [Acidobacteriaceae bacterium]
MNGNTEYYGKFLPYSGKDVIRTDKLKIDARKTRENTVWIGTELVPLVYLEDGMILIPRAKYEDGVRLLDQLKSTE